MKKTLRGMSLAAFAVLYSVTLFVLGTQFGAEEEVQPTGALTVPAEVNSIDAFRTERQQLRQQQIAQLNDIIHSDNASPEIVGMAQTRLIDLMEWSEMETTLEGVLQIRDFEDVVATVHNDSVNIMVLAESLNQQQTAVIMDLVQRETAISGGNVKIVPIK